MKENSEKITTATRLRPLSQVLLRVEFGEEGILFDPDSGSVHILNETAVAIWKMLDGKKSIEDISEGLKDRFTDISPQSGNKIIDLARRLYEIGVIEIV